MGGRESGRAFPSEFEPGFLPSQGTPPRLRLVHWPGVGRCFRNNLSSRDSASVNSRSRRSSSRTSARASPWALPSEDPLDVEPILRSSGERFQHHEIFGRTRRYLRPAHTKKLGQSRVLRTVGHRRNIERYADSRLHQRNPVRQRELARGFDAWPVVSYQRINEGRLGADVGKYGEVHTGGLTRVAPTLYGESVEDACAPSSLATARLDVEVAAKSPLTVGGSAVSMSASEANQAALSVSAASSRHLRSSICR